MTLWFYEIEKGSLSTELLSLSLASGHHGSFAGQGFLKWNATDGIEIGALTNGGQALSRSFVGHNSLPVGTLIPPDHYLGMTATTRAGDSIVIERLRFDGYDAYTSHETVAWSIDRTLLASVVDFTKGPKADKAELVTFLLSNGEGLVWPRISSVNRGCLQATTKLGEVKAFALPNGNVKVSVEPNFPLEISRIVDAVGYAFSFWAGKILPVIAYEARIGESVLCRLFPTRHRPTPMENPPFGHVISLSLEAQHETLIQTAIDFFASDTRNKIGPLIHTRLSCHYAPFSVGILILCAALEGIAKEIAKSEERQKAISDSQKADTNAFLLLSGFPDELIERFQGFMGVINSPSGANAIAKWCREGFLGFTAQDWDAWTCRNKSAHGNFALLGESFDERKSSVANRERLSNMVNKLVMHAIGFKGRYLDYAAHLEQEFPPQVPSIASAEELIAKSSAGTGEL